MERSAPRGQLSGRLRPSMLRTEATSFVGRSGELRQITALLRSARLVTLTGPAGVGKTRLCQRAAMLAANQFPDGAWLADLSGLRDPTQLYSAVAAAFKLPERDMASLRTAVLDRLRDRKLLLILDTCEHLADACAAFTEDVLQASAGITTLTTSRQPLDAPGEHAFPVPPLPVRTDAVELFAQRATAVAPDFEVTPDSRDDVIRLCRRLDGIPLAIELAAVRLRALPLRELAARLETGFGVLAVSRRGTTPRHQTLRAAIEWDHALCTRAERRLWARLSVFAGTFDVEAAEDVCASDDLPREKIIHVLAGLVDKSVVLRSGDGENRYRLPGALREYGAEQLAASGDQPGTRDRLTTWCLGMASYFDEHFLGDDQADRYRLLLREYPNIAAALQHALDDQHMPASGDGPPAPARRGAELAIRLHAFWRISGRLCEGRQWLEKVLRLFPAPTPESGRAPAPERIRALVISGRLATFQGDIPRALAEIGESIGQAGEAGEELAAAHGYRYLSLALACDGQHEAALHAMATARRRLTARGHRAGLICLEPQLALVHQFAGNAEAAIECCERGIAMLGASSRERWVTSGLALTQGLALFQFPDREADCAGSIRRALIAKHELGDESGIGSCLAVLGWLAARAGRFERAAWLFGAAERRGGRALSQPVIPAIAWEAHQHSAAVTRAALGDRRYQAARAQGARLPLDTAVRRALGGPGAPPDGTRGDGNGTAKNAAAGGAAWTDVLTRREQEIAGLVASGLSNREIASKLFISKRTVDAHIEHIFGKLEVSSRVQLTNLLRGRTFTGRH